jgi:hypothetical protein
MYKRALVIGAVVVALGAGLVMAQEDDALKTAVLAGTIKGTASGPVAGTCASSGYAAVCPSGTCSCLTVAGTVTGQLAGKGLASVAITEDGGLSTNSTGSTCVPGFGTATLTTSKGVGKNKVIKSETLNLTVSVCDVIRNSGDISGGFGISSAPAPSPAAAGWGSVDGFQRNTTVVLNLKGSITQ